MWDGLEREWAPAFYLGDRQLFHAHAADRLGVTISVATRIFAPVAVASTDVPLQLRKIIDRARDYGGTKWIFLTLDSDRDVLDFATLVRFKHAFYTQPTGKGLRRPG
jgi:hypothetical protein